MIDYSKPIRKTTITGKNVPVYKTPTQEKTATPKTVEQVILPDENYNLSKVTIEPVTSSIDDNIQPQNILLGKTILGVQGNLAPDKPDQNKTVTPTKSQQVVQADTGYELAQVTVEGVTSAIDSNIQPFNIREGVTILGVEGNLAPDKPDQTKTINPTTSEQVVMADEGYELASVTVTAVTSDIDNNIQPENIKQGVEILGVQGTLEQGASEEQLDQWAAVNTQLEQNIGTYATTPSTLSKLQLMVSGQSFSLSKYDLQEIAAISNFAFYRSTIATIDIPDSVTSIGFSAFYECTNLRQINIPKNITNIGGYAFWGCTGLSSIIIPDNVTIIGDYAFHGCEGLSEITIPDSVTNIGTYVFAQCSNLVLAIINARITLISTAAFRDCRALNSVTIPDSVTNIGTYAFAYCTSLTSIIIPHNVESIGYVPDASVDTYKQATNWVQYADQIQPLNAKGGTN